MKIREFTILGELTEANKLALMSFSKNIPGVKDATLLLDSDSVFTLSLILSPSADPQTVSAEVRRAAEHVGVKMQEAEAEADGNVPADVHGPTDEESGKPKESFLWSLTVNSSDQAAPPKDKKPGRRVSLAAAVSSVITAVVLAVLLTFSLTTTYMKNNTPHTVTPGQGQTEEGPFDRLEVIDRLFRSATVLEPQDREVLLTAILKSYVAATGDVYAEYFTAEEFAEQTSSNNGEMCGIGVSVVNGILNLNGVDYQVITIANVYPDSPAEAAGVLPGDHIMYVGTGDQKTLVHDIGYTEALNRMRGEEGSVCAFTVLRRPAGASEETSYEEVEISAVRQKFTTLSVTYRHYSEDETVGIIRITGFDNTTRDQFVDAVETLKAEGCQSFVLDLRGNPGGLLSSVEDILVFFLQEDDVIITTKDASGRESSDTVTHNRAGNLLCGTGQLTEADIGKYRGLNFTVLVNEYSASAAELFTSNIRDYELGKIVGTTTFGKGCGQTTYSLSRYGYDGALKLTTFYYSSPLGDYYDGVGITPHVEVELSEEAKTYNINLLPDHLDNQLAAAVEALQ